MPLLAPVLILLLGLPGAQASRLNVQTSLDRARAAPGEALELRVDLEVQPGWHIYAPTFKGTGIPTSLEVEPGHLAAEGKLKHPEPIKKRDAVLEEDVLYHEGKLRLVQPLRVAAGAPPGKTTVRAKLTYQACTESMCDLPKEVPLLAEVEIGPRGEGGGEPGKAAEAAPPPPSRAPPALPGLGPFRPRSPGGDAKAKRSKGEKLTFRLRAEPARLARGGRGEVVAEYEVQEGSYIYAPEQPETLGKPTRILLDEKLARPAGPTTARPPAKRKHDPLLNETSLILEGKGEVRRPFTLSAEAPPGKLELPVTVEYMVCDAQTCVPGEFSGRVEVELEEGPPVEGPGPAPAAGAPPPDAGNARDGLGGWLKLIGLALFSGLLALVMPCTYPMIPITISFFTKQAERRHTRVLPLALAYGAGIVLDFILIGLVVGEPIQNFATHWATNSVFAILFIVFGLSLLGLFELRLPSSVNALAGRAAGVQGYAGVFLIGLTFVITSFTCSAPIVGLVLAAGAQAGFAEVVVGMGIFGLTLALPFVVLALFPARARTLPRAGEWMHTLKVTLGFVELGAALKFVSNVDVQFPSLKMLPAELFLYVLAGIALTTALYLFGAVRLKGEGHEVGPLRMVWGMVFLLLSFYFVYATGLPRQNPVMAAFLPPYRAAAGGPQVQVEKWIRVDDDLEAGLQRARQEGKLALLNWTGIT